MGNTLSEAQKSVSLNWIQSNRTNNNATNNLHNFTSTAETSPPSECLICVKVGEENPRCDDARKADKINPLNMMTPYNQQPASDQLFLLPTERVVYNIPKSEGDGEFRSFPFAQMFWNTMLHKGWRWKDNNLSPKDVIIKIHNINNELALSKILKWEAFSAKDLYVKCMNPKLKSFGGKAKNYPLEARIRHWVGYELPFDRHDWIVDRCVKNGKYVIDYYYTDNSLNKYQDKFVDVRPALDSFDALWDHTKATYWRWQLEAEIETNIANQIEELQKVDQE